MSYLHLSPSSSRPSVASALDNVINASPFAVGDDERRDLINALINDLDACSRGDASRLAPEDSPRALLAIKNLGKHPNGASVIARQNHLSTLLAISSHPAFKSFPEASSEALRCVANTLLLTDSARSAWISTEVGGGDAAIKLFEKSLTPDEIFLASRILFLTTASAASAGSYIISLIEEKQIIDTIASKVDILTTAILSGTKMAKEAMTDVLKLSFNLLLHYPKLVDCESQDMYEKSGNAEEDKVMGDYWSPKLDGILPPLLRVFNTLPPSSPSPLAPPLTHAIHSLITIPFTPSLRPLWLPTASLSSSKSSRSSHHSQPSTSATPSSSSTGSDSPTTSSKTSTLERAFSALSAGARSFSRTPSPLHTSPKADTLLRAYDLLDVTLAHFLPGNIDPDDPSVKERCTAECGETTLDELIAPLVVLLTRFCIADEASRTKIRNFIVPPDLDRKNPLEARSDILGRCLRLLSCVYHEPLKQSVGEMMYTMCDSDTSTLIALVGYGNVAGYLFNKGIMNAPPQSSSSDSPSFSAAINPITGTEVTQQPLPEMTDEEKEHEAEKLFVLFDRLERTGAIQPDQNPVRKAIQRSAQ